MEIAAMVTDICNQDRKVLSFAKKIFGSTFTAEVVYNGRIKENSQSNNDKENTFLLAASEFLLGNNAAHHLSPTFPGERSPRLLSFISPL
jgi:hypothetical protein